MTNNLKKADFTIVTAPIYVTWECPYCGKEFEDDYKEFSTISDNPGHWSGEKVECPNCKREIIIDDVDWD